MSIMIALAATSLAATKAPAPKVMTDEQLDTVVAGLTIVNKAGKPIWEVTSVDPLEGTNNGGNGNTDRTAGGLLKAVAAGGLGAQ